MPFSTPEEKLAANAKIIMSFNDNPADEEVCAGLAPCYYQHNLVVPDTKAGYMGALGGIYAAKQAGQMTLSSKIHRQFYDPAGEGYTFFHAEYEFFGPKMGFDVCRWEDGLVVEHWDNLQEIPQDGTDVFGGPKEPTDLDKTEENKELVRKYTFNVLCCGLVEQVPKYVAEDVISHVSGFPSGRLALEELIIGLNEKGLKYYKSRHLLVGCGNFVMVGGQGKVDMADDGSPDAGIWDMYRVEGGKIVEHWMIVEPLMPPEKHAHKNGKW
jgi:predicted SnoaL-like aldol condensation-catalyzing enzyme